MKRLLAAFVALLTLAWGWGLLSAPGAVSTARPEARGQTGAMPAPGQIPE